MAHQHAHWKEHKAACKASQRLDQQLPAQSPNRNRYANCNPIPSTEEARLASLKLCEAFPNYCIVRLHSIPDNDFGHQQYNGQLGRVNRCFCREHSCGDDADEGLLCAEVLHFPAGDGPFSEAEKRAPRLRIAPACCWRADGPNAEADYPAAAVWAFDARQPGFAGDLKRREEKNARLQIIMRSEQRAWIKAGFACDMEVVSKEMLNVESFTEHVRQADNDRLLAMHARMDQIQCAGCEKKPNLSTEIADFKKCACKTVRYCSKECQAEHWKEHKKQCKKASKKAKKATEGK